MGDLVLKGSTSGQITVTPTAVAGTNTLTLPAKTGNIITSADSGTVTQTMLGTNVAGNGPAFSAYISATQSVSNNTNTKVAFNTKEFDTATCYDTTNYRFTPNVAGYYQVNATYFFAGYAYQQISIYKNGSVAKAGTYAGSAVALQNMVVSSIIQMNGTTDYLEVFVYQSSGSSQTGGSTGSNVNYFQAALVRSA